MLGKSQPHVPATEGCCRPDSIVSQLRVNPIGAEKIYRTGSSP